MTFESYCDDMRFYNSESHQIVYVSLQDKLPFHYRPTPVEAITPEIANVCRVEGEDEMYEEIVFASQDGLEEIAVTHMVEKEQIGVEGRDLVIYSLDDSQRMTSFRVHHKTLYSMYMTEFIWNMIEVRIVCLVEGFDMPLEAMPTNIQGVF